MDAAAFDEKGFIRTALGFIVLYFSVIMIAMMMAKPAHASGSLSTPPSLQYSVSFWVIPTNTTPGSLNPVWIYTSRPISCTASSLAGLAPCVAAVAGGPVSYYSYDGNYYGGNPWGFTDAIASHIGCPNHAQPAGNSCTCTDPYMPDPAGTSCVPAPICTVTTKVADIMDPVAKQYENGTYSTTKPDLVHLTPATQAGLACIQQRVAAMNGYQTPQATSGYRPTVYQKHILEVYDKWQLIKDDNTPACAETKAGIQKEFIKHSRFARRPGVTSNHSQVDAQGNPAGEAVDISFVPDNTNASADAIACQCNMYRPMINMPNPKDNDPVHYQPRACPR